MSKTKYIVLLLIGFIFANIIIYGFTQHNKNERIAISLQTHSNKLETHVNILKYQQKLNANSAYNATVSSPKVIDILTKAYKTKDSEIRNSLRDKLYNLLKDNYARMKTHGILQYHFVFPDNTVFFRFHKVDKYSDSLVGVRSDFEYTNRTHKRIVGFAQG